MDKTGIMDWIRRVFSEIVSAPGAIRQWAALSTKNRVIALLGAAAAAAMLIAVIVYYIRCIIRKKRETPFALFAVLLLIGFGLWEAQNFIVRYQLPEAAVVQTDAGDLLIYDRYSLAPGSTIPDHPNMMNPFMMIVDNTFTWRINDALILQLTDIRTLRSDHPLSLSSVSHEGEDMLYFETDYPASGGGTTFVRLYLYVLPDTKLEDEAWYLESGGEITTKRDFGLEGFIDQEGKLWFSPPTEDFHILENGGDRVLFAVSWNSGEEIALCDARQIGPDLVVAVSVAFTNHWNDTGNGPWHQVFDPLADEEECIFLREPLDNLYDGRLRLLRGLSAEDAERVLPGKVIHYPVPLCSEVAFSFPCRELLELASNCEIEEFQARANKIRFIGEGPDGKEHLYSIVNLGGMMYSSILSDQELDSLHKEFEDAYHEGLSTRDEIMSEFIGIPAVPYRDGWLLYIGKCFGDQQYYYYLTEDNIPA